VSEKRVGRRTENVFDWRHRQLSRRLLDLRKEIGLTQSELAERLNKSRVWVSHYESNRKTMTFIEVIDILSILTEDKGLEFLSKFHSEVIEKKKSEVEKAQQEKPKVAINPFMDDIMVQHRNKPWKFQHPKLLKLNFNPWFHFPEVSSALIHVILDNDPWILSLWLNYLKEPEKVTDHWGTKACETMHHLGEEACIKGIDQYKSLHSFLMEQELFRDKRSSWRYYWKLLKEKKKVFKLKYQEQVKKQN